MIEYVYDLSEEESCKAREEMDKLILSEHKEPFSKNDFIFGVNENKEYFVKLKFPELTKKQKRKALIKKILIDCSIAPLLVFTAYALTNYSWPVVSGCFFGMIFYTVTVGAKR